MIMEIEKIDAIIGIDPGKGGAISMWRNGLISTVYMPKTLKDLNDYLHYIEEVTENPIVFCEHVNARPDDMFGGKAFAIIKMLKQYNELVSYLQSNHLPVIPVMAITWQKRLKVYVKGEDYDTRKKRLKEVTKILHPELKITLKNCDSVLILRFGRYMMVHDPEWIADRFNEDYKLF